MTSTFGPTSQGISRLYMPAYLAAASMRLQNIWTTRSVYSETIYRSSSGLSGVSDGIVYYFSFSKLV